MAEAIDPIDGRDDQPRRTRRAGKRRAPGRPRALDHDTVVRTAVHIADTDGVAALTMARLASELSVAVMTLYTYIPTKDQLLDEVIDAVLGQTTLPIPPEDPSRWREVLLDTFVEFHDVALAHWKLVESVGTRTSIGPAVTSWLEAVLRVLRSAGFDSRERVAIYREVVSYMLGDLQLRISHLPGLSAGRAGAEPGDEPEFPLVEETTNLVHGLITREHFALGLRRILESLPEATGPEARNLVGADRAVPLGDRPLPAEGWVASGAGAPTGETQTVGSEIVAPGDMGSAPSGLREHAVALVAEVVENYDSESSAIESVAEKLGVSREVLGRWVLRSRVGDDFAAPHADQLAELHYLRTENQELRRANEILKTASAFLASELDRPKWRW